MSCKIDENLLHKACAFFRQAAHDAVTIGEQRLGGTTDNELYAACQQEGRALVTLGVDFANVQAYPPGQFPGVIVLCLKEQSRPAALSAIGSVLSLLQHEPVNGRLWIVEEQRIRIRA